MDFLIFAIFTNKRFTFILKVWKILNGNNIIAQALFLMQSASIFQLKLRQKICTNIIIITGNDRNDPMKRFIMRVYDTLRVVRKKPMCIFFI